MDGFSYCGARTYEVVGDAASYVTATDGLLTVNTAEAPVNVEILITLNVSFALSSYLIEILLLKYYLPLP